MMNAYVVSLENSGGVLDSRYALGDEDAAEKAIEIIREASMLAEGDVIRVKLVPHA